MTSSRNKYLFIDFEFNKTTHNYLNLVSAAYWWTTDLENFQKASIWLHNDENAKDELWETLDKFISGGYITVCFSGEAEGRSYLSLIPDLKLWTFPWIDLWVEYRHLSNQNNSVKYGKQLIDGKIRNIPVPKPKWERIEGEKGSQEPEQGLAAAVFKLLGKKIDTKRKNAVRDLIISAPLCFTDEEKQEILEYNESDIIYMPALLKEIVARYRKLLRPSDRQNIFKEMLWRGEFSARSAFMVNDGYPINYDKTKAFSNSVPMILKDLIRDINSQFDDFKPFRWDKNEQKFKWRQKDTRQYIRDEYPQHVKGWMLTKSKELSLSLEAWSRFFDFAHDYPRGNFGAQIVRYLKVKQSLNGFIPKTQKVKGKKDRTFWDYVGPDKMVRPFMNIYRSQSARSQPSAKGFIFLKAAWMRVLVEPPKGYAIITLDWASQEFLIGALMSNDKNMLKAYQSGDPYLWFAKAAKAIPPEGTREEYGPLRDAFKSTTLAEMYMMGIKALANKLTNDTGKKYTEEDAEDLDALFTEVFSVFCDWRNEQVDLYGEKGYLKTLDGWFMWGDNINFRSITNCPIQGAGSSIMRKSMALTQDKDLQMLFTLHDALYILVKLNELYKVDDLADAMDEGFRYYFPDKIKPLASCRMDAVVWSPELKDCKWVSEGGIQVEQKSMYIDKRSIADYEKFKKYFEVQEVEDWL